MADTVLHGKGGSVTGINDTNDDAVGCVRGYTFTRTYAEHDATCFSDAGQRVQVAGAVEDRLSMEVIGRAIPKTETDDDPDNLNSVVLTLESGTTITGALRIFSVEVTSSYDDLVQYSIEGSYPSGATIAQTDLVP